MVALFGIGLGTLLFVIERKLKTKGGIMSTPETATEPTPQVKSKMAVFGGVSVHNVQLISEKMLKIIEYIFTVMEPNSGLISIIMKGDGGPTMEGKQIMAALYPDSLSASFNLDYHWTEALDIVETDKKNEISLRAMLWYNALVSIFHEIHHAKDVLNAEKPNEIVWDEAKEEEATKFAQGRIIDLAKVFPVELPTNEEEPFFGERFKTFRENIDKGRKKWIGFQRELYDNNVAGRVTTEDQDVVTFNSFKEFIKWTCNTEAERLDPVWGNETVIVTEKELPKADLTLNTPIAPGQAVLPEDLNEPVFPEFEDYCDEDVPFNLPQNTPAAAPTQQNVYTPQTPAQPTRQQAPIQQVPATGLTVEEEKFIVKTVLMRIYNHVFGKCGFDPNAPTSFTNAGAAFEAINIGDIPNVQKMFISMDITDSAGQDQYNVSIANEIKGKVFKTSKLPGYWLWLNIGGYKMKRSIVPQNPDKTHPDGSLKKMAVKARQGHMIMWSISDEVGDTPSEIKVLIETPPGGPITYTELPYRN